MNLKDPVLMGILNVTPDSFSDGGEHYSLKNAVARALKMKAEGADIIDIGGESSRPGSEPVTAEEELSRVLPVIRGIIKSMCHCESATSGRSNLPNVGSPLISIDTTKSVVAREAVLAGAGMINDISAGTADKDMFSVMAEAGVPVCLMHMRGRPKTMQKGEIEYKDVVGEIIAYLKSRVELAVQAGIKRENIIVDPGIGFGKTVEHNVTILKEISRFKELGFPILVGASRKSFIGKILGIDDPKQRLEGSLATLAVALKGGATFFRVHDVLESRRFLKVLTTLFDQRKM